MSALLHGMAAGAAGTTALNAVSYLDMAWRGRPESSTPEQTVHVMSQRLGVDLAEDDGTRRNREAGVGALLGIATGVGFGAVWALLIRHQRPRVTRSALALGLGAMAGSNTGMIRLGVTDPREWSRADWAADILPHVAYGVVTAAVLDALRRR
jgi:hypothetical protein